MNATVYTNGSDDPFSVRTPWYYTSAPSVFPGVPDEALALAAPVIAYWGFSLFFHVLDISTWRWLDKYRIHESAEVAKRNRVSRLDVVKAVVFQHVVQTALGWWWMNEKGPVVSHAESMRAMAPTVRRLLGYVLPAELVAAREEGAVYFAYWWAIPIAQLLFAMFIIDTWQYFLHRAMHVNKWMYKHFHSWHHRLYVPYAYGALYNHPFEGFLLDTLGTAIAETASFMTVRQATFLFTISTLKTVDDHCGYTLPFDPFQWVTSNDADYHDIHHQVIGIKSNFSQPFFVHWDVILGTRMTRTDIAQRKKSLRKED